MRTAEILSEIRAVLQNAGVENPLFEAELLASVAGGFSRTKLISQMRDQYPPEAEEKLFILCKRRASREPFAYITGTKEFYGLEFSVTPDVLIPRPETEALVDASKARLPNAGRFLDLCCGSGVVGIALKSCRDDAQVSASDISPKALQVAEKNASALLGEGAITFIESDLFRVISGTFDIIAVNPPYVADDERASLAPELDFEPHSALFSEDRGFHHTQQIISQAGRFLKKGGYLLIETNPRLKERVTECAALYGFSVSIENDLAGFSRFFFLKML